MAVKSPANNENKSILESLLLDYVSGIPDKASTYHIIKQNIVHNYIVKYNPSHADLIDMLGLLFVNNETFEQILDRC